MTPEEESLRDLWMAEMWPVCREVPREERDQDDLRSWPASRRLPPPRTRTPGAA